MTELIAARAIQGLGAGAVIPLSLTIVGEIYALEERGRAQALFSGVWGVASIAGPLVGGYITDALSWRWVFYLNLPFGLLAIAIIAFAYPASAPKASARVDWAGALLLFGGITALLVALGDVTEVVMPWIVATVVLLAVFILVERRAADPIMPLDLFRHAVVSHTLVVVFMTGMAMFGAIAFVPLFVQVAKGGTATQAGQVLTPLFLGWVATSIAGARLTVRAGYRPIAILGGSLLTAGFVALAVVGADTSMPVLLGIVFVLGSGMGFSMLSLLLAVQHGVDRSLLGLATSLNQFSRSVGAAVGVAVMGAILARGLAATNLPSAGPAMAAGAMQLDALAKIQFVHALNRAFGAGAIMAAAGLVAAFFLPPVDFSRGVPVGTGERMVAAEMASLESEGEPEGVELPKT